MAFLLAFMGPDPALEALFDPMPLRVGTEGSIIYHRPFCPYAQAALATHGAAKRINWYSIDEIPSNRIPDTFCKAHIFECRDVPGFVSDETSQIERRSYSIPTADCDIVQNFTGLSDGSQPPDWLDTDFGNSLVENDSLFYIAWLGGNPMLKADAALTNYHSHYTAFPGWGHFVYSGRMRRAANSGVGLTFLSDYPNSDRYYRIRTTGSDPFNFYSHGPDTQNNDTSLGVTMAADTWYQFKIEVNVATATTIKAKVWAESAPEPAWQLDITQDSPERYTDGTVGLWTMGSGDRYWDDLTLELIPCDPANICEWSGYAAISRPDCGQPDDEQSLYLNAIPSGIGDANGDAAVTSDDFAYLVACLQSASPGQNCKNCFDYDNDGNIDIDDTQQFLSELNSSNAAWIAANAPEATEVPVDTIPLRVGMIGSNLYHKEGCRYVENSRANYGNHLYIEFYTREQIENTNRTPNTTGGPDCDATLP
jgi:hypothetical protein